MTLQLRPYQREAVDAISAYFSRKTGHPLVVIPTAGGKSLIMATFIQEALREYPERILIVTHVRELIRQNYDELLRCWPDAPAGINSAGLKMRDTTSNIIFCGIQSVFRKAAKIGHVDLILVDEAHLMPRAAETMYRKFLNDLFEINPHLKVIGFTATPFRLDSGQLHRGDGALFTDVAYDANLLELIEQGYLCRPRSKSADAQIDTRGVGTRGGEFIQDQLQAAAIHPEVVEAVADEIVANGEGRIGWLVFGTGVEHCRLMRGALHERGITCASIFGDTPPTERDAIIQAFKRQEIQALVSMGVLTTGFNATHVDLIAVVRPTKSTGLWIQICGRGTRLHPGKEDCLILDMGGNILRHGALDKPRVTKEKRVDAIGEAPVKMCEFCEAVNPLAARECVACGKAFPPIIQVVNTTASTVGLLSVDQAKPQWADVSSVSYRRHEKPGKPPSLRVTYTCGFNQHFDYVCLEHTGFARQKAVEWWRRHAPQTAIPNTTAEALNRKSEIRIPRRIAVRQDGQYTKVVGATW